MSHLSYRTTSLPATPPGNSSGRRTIVIAVAALFFCSCCFCAMLAAGYWAVTSGPLAEVLTPPPSQRAVPAGKLTRDQTRAAEAASAFVLYLQGADWPAAYAMCTPALQRQLDSAAALGRHITEARSQPASALVVEDVGEVQTANGRSVASVIGTARFATAAAGPVRIDLELVGTDWKVNGFSLNLSN
jgi:hypothetical protein